MTHVLGFCPSCAEPIEDDYCANCGPVRGKGDSASVPTLAHATFPLVTPHVPNFISVDGPKGAGGEPPKLALADIPDDQLRLIGGLWTAALLKRAKEMRGDRELPV